MPLPLLLDTGIVYALADRRDAWHERARALVRHEAQLLILPVTVLPEAAYLIQSRLGAAVERRLVESLVAGEIQVEPLQTVDLERCLAVLDRHPEIGFVDATVVAVAERLGLTRLATTDRRHFARIRPRHCPALELVP